MQSHFDSICILKKHSATEITYLYTSNSGHISVLALNFRNFTYCDLISGSKPQPWPFLEGASGLSTLLYAIQLEL